MNGIAGMGLGIVVVELVVRMGHDMVLGNLTDSVLRQRCLLL